MSGWFIYWLTRVESIGMFFFTGGILLGIGSMVVGMTYCIDGGENGFDKDAAKILGKWLKKLIVACIVLFAIVSFIPSTGDLAAIYVIPKIVNNEQCKDIPEKMMGLLNAKLDQWFNESIRKSKKEKDNIEP
jgi:hypothetical protein